VLSKFDGFVKSLKTPVSVIPAKAGIQEKQALLDPGFRRGDGFDDFLRTHQISCFRVCFSLGFAFPIVQRCGGHDR
jgi:hypothetical protein